MIVSETPEGSSNIRSGLSTDSAQVQQIIITYLCSIAIF